MNFVLLYVEFKHRNESEVASEVPLHQSDGELVRFRLLDFLPQLAVNLVKVLEIALVHHREISPELEKFSCFINRVFSFRLGLRKPGPNGERLFRNFVAKVNAVLVVNQDV